MWGDVCHHVKREASRFIPSILILGALLQGLLSAFFTTKPGGTGMGLSISPSIVAGRRALTRAA